MSSGPTEAPKEPTIEDRLAEAREFRAQREAKRHEADQLRELLVLDLEAKYEAELGPRGAAYQVEVFEDLDKVIVLKRPDRLVVKRFDEAGKKKLGASEAETLDYVLPSLLYPTKEEFREWTKVHPSIVLECTGSLRQMEGLRIREQLGKPRT
jgi:hypothetical protein